MTVAEIADAANVSVKTVFTYVNAKEELIFRQQEPVLDAVVRAVASRRLGQTPLVAAAQALLAAVNEADENLSLGSFQRMVASGPAARSRVRALWDETETRLAEVLGVRRRAVAAGNSQSSAPLGGSPQRRSWSSFRTVTSDEVADLLVAGSSAANSPTPVAARRSASRCTDQAGHLAQGLQSPAR